LRLPVSILRIYGLDIANPICFICSIRWQSQIRGCGERRVYRDSIEERGECQTGLCMEQNHSG